MDGHPIGEVFAQRAVALDEALHGGDAGIDALEVISLVEISQQATYVYSAVAELHVLPVYDEDIGRLGRVLRFGPWTTW